MKVFVINKHGETMMPCSPLRAKKLIKKEEAKVVSRSPFIIQLKYGSSGHKQELTLGVDTGHTYVGLSVVSETKEVFSATAKLRNDISKKMDTRKMYRRSKRNKLRYRQKRFLNRSASTRKGRLPPSVQWKVDAHIKLINQMKAYMPITRVVIETGTFDIQKMNNKDITNDQYQKGVQYEFENVKAYVLSRDSHECQCVKTGCSLKLEVHHIIYRSKGGANAPNNLITLCSKHHKQLHANKLTLDVKKHKNLKAATAMNVIRKRLLETFPDAIETFGYVTKANRYDIGMDKTHANDAFVIAGGTTQERATESTINFKRKNNRCLQKNRKGFKRSIRRQHYQIRPKDIVMFEGKRYQAVGIHCGGGRLIITSGARPISRQIKKIKVVYHQKGVIYA